MGITERREREKEALRTRIIESARDIVSEEGLDTLSMRAIAERIEYSPGTIYLYFRDKDELLEEVVRAGFGRLRECIRGELESAGPWADARAQHRALGRAYARFALENTAYFRVMFELPTVPQLGRVVADSRPVDGTEGGRLLVETIRKAIDAGLYEIEGAETGAMIAWGLVHGVTSLYLSGHLSREVASTDAFFELVERAMDSLGMGWVPRAGGSKLSA